jgi:hypothetical protein
MDTRLLHQFDKELTVEYRGEAYRARDNGSVSRQRRPNKRKRSLDDKWTFGWANAATGYLQIGTEVVHRIIATAFYGKQPSEKHLSITSILIVKITALRTCVGSRGWTTCFKIRSRFVGSYLPTVLSMNFSRIRVRR